MLRFFLWTFVLLLTAWPLWAQDSAPDTAEATDIERCINLGNMLEAPNEGDWGLVVQEDWLQVIADAGFDSVRIPIKWSGHALREAPYTIDESFLARVDEVVGWTLDAGLQAIVNIHHYDEIMQQPADEYERLLGLWEQIATYFQDYPDTVIFEVLNEPNSRLTASIWNGYQADLVALIRETNPERRIVVGPGRWNAMSALEDLKLPEDSDNLIVTFHNYEPFEFTHQGAEWVGGSSDWLGRTWETHADVNQLGRYFDQVARWQETFGLPMLMGEFGAYSRADQESRLRWTSAVVEHAEALGVGWCYWEFAAGFGIYDAASDQFNDLYRALIPAES